LPSEEEKGKGTERAEGEEKNKTNKNPIKKNLAGNVVYLFIVF
jgi:hypothetical protein